MRMLLHIAAASQCAKLLIYKYTARIEATHTQKHEHRHSSPMADEMGWDGGCCTEASSFAITNASVYWCNSCRNVFNRSRCNRVLNDTQNQNVPKRRYSVLRSEWICDRSSYRISCVRVHQVWTLLCTADAINMDSDKMAKAMARWWQEVSEFTTTFVTWLIGIVCCEKVSTLRLGVSYCISK